MQERAAVKITAPDLTADFVTQWRLQQLLHPQAQVDPGANAGVALEKGHLHDCRSMPPRTLNIPEKDKPLLAIGKGLLKTSEWSSTWNWLHNEMDTICSLVLQIGPDLDGKLNLSFSKTEKVSLVHFQSARFAGDQRLAISRSFTQRLTPANLSVLESLSLTLAFAVLLQPYNYNLHVSVIVMSFFFRRSVERLKLHFSCFGDRYF
jgi:hypothetical protein